ncbi:VOC family protein [Pseudofrankia inefficax]|nr:VOC family protein [Pseudofrankia inefficax]
MSTSESAGDDRAVHSLIARGTRQLIWCLEELRELFMRRRMLLLVVPLVLAVGCGSTGGHAAATPSARLESNSTPPVAATTFSIETVPTATASASKDPAGPTGTIMMIKLNVGSLDAGVKFYGAVFGAKLALKIQSNAGVVTFPNGGPGLILLPGHADGAKAGAFVIQVPNLREAQARAVSNGATVQGEFTGTPNNQTGRSIDLLDPWGNQVEILQLG